MQHYGLLRDEDADCDLDSKEALSMIEELLIRVKNEYSEAVTLLKAYYLTSTGEQVDD